MRRAYAMLCLLLVGCDPTAGLSDSADAALPKIKRYFDGRGSQVAEGPWNRVVIDLDAETLYHVGGRRLDDEEPTFHLFGQDAREGCQVAPNAGTWLMGKAPGAPFRVVPFLESIDERGRGRLRFTSLDCAVQDLVLEDAGRPYPRLYDDGFLVPTKRGYTFADPWRGTTREIAENLQGILVWDQSILVWADDTIKSFTGRFERGPSWGNVPRSVLAIGGDFLIEDADGLHRVSFNQGSFELKAEPVLEGVCNLQTSTNFAVDGQSIWVVAEAPCGSPEPSLLQLDEKSWEQLDQVKLPFEADATHARALVMRDPGANAGAEPERGVAFLTDVADDTGFGKVWIWREGQDEPVALGEQGEIETLFLQQQPADWAGIVQVNYRELGGVAVHDWLRFRWDGETTTVAESVVRNNVSGETLFNFDGVAGDLPKFEGDGYEVLIKGVPTFSGEATSYVGDRHYARVDTFDGDAGRLLLGTTGNPAEWSALGSNVPPDQVRFSWFMPALVFLEDWDAKNRSGKLVAYNYELDARATIAEGVSSFDLTSYPWDGVVYSVPRGKQRGIWFSKAK